ncbi:unnamed protein product [Pedinophyceae sp. YPF-701]|nr:unnamed protein product [Pedinophyceae sp. YPF-701]
MLRSVIKVGTSSLIDDETGTLALSSIAGICEVLARLQRRGHQVVLVSSGAVGAGCLKMGLSRRPADLAARQALAAVGQVHLMRMYDDLLTSLKVTCAQVLLTPENLASRPQYLNARNTFEALLRMGTIPIVNENDTVAVSQLRFGDNDTMSAQVAALVHADYLFLLTDVDALYTSNPSLDPQAKRIAEVHDLSELAVDTSTSGTQWGTGGMATKLTAARIATAAGCNVVVGAASAPDRIVRVLSGELHGTLFHAHPRPLRSRRRWILAVPPKGSLWLDAGAVRAVRDKRKSLFASGVVEVEGEFNAEEAVRLCGPDGQEFARGLSNYASGDARRLRGLASSRYDKALGYVGPEEVCHRDNVALLEVHRNDESGDEM